MIIKVKSIFLLLFVCGNLLAQPMLKLISPNGGEVLTAGERYSISWMAKEIDKVVLEYTFDNNEWHTIHSGIISEIGSYSWKVPNRNSESFLIRISELGSENNFDVSDSYLSVKSKINFTLSKKNSAGDPVKILPLGNSITFDNRSSDNRAVEDKAGYRVYLHELLTNAGYNFEFIGSEHAGSNKFSDPAYDANAGFPGIRDDQLAYLLQTGDLVMEQYGVDDSLTNGPYLNTYTPDVVLLHIGTNGNSLANGMSPDDVEYILDEIKWYEDTSNNEVTVFLSRIIDRVPNESFVTTFNDSVVLMAQDRISNPMNDAYPDKIIFIDMQSDADLDYAVDYMGTVDNGIYGDMSDALHPNDKGYLKMAQAWFDSLETFFGEPISITSQPQSIASIANESVSFEVVASGVYPIVYQWKKNGVDIVGANDSILIIQNISIEDNETEYSCIVSNNSSTIESNIVKLFVYDENTRVNGDQVVLYTFEEGDGNIIYDNSNYGEPINLEIDFSSRVKWIPYGLKVEDKSLISSTSSTHKLFSECSSSNEITIEAWVKPKDNLQGGPARIVTFSNDGSNRNFTLGQNGDIVSTRIRTTSTSYNGLPGLNSTDESVTDSLQHIVFIRDSLGVAKIFVDGILNSTDNITGDFSNWDSTYIFGIADEFNSSDTDRFWLGTFYLVSVYSRALEENEVFHNYSVQFEGIDKLLEIPTDLDGIIEEDTLVTLTWTDNTDNESGFIIERKADDIDSTFIVLDSLEANSESFIDNYSKYTSSYIYKVKAYNGFSQSDYSDSITITGIVTNLNDNQITSEFKLNQNYPNPFNPSTVISYSIPELSDVSISVFNTIGEKVREILSEKQNQGLYNVTFESDNLVSGIYFLRLHAKSSVSGKNYTSSIKMIVLK